MLLAKFEKLNNFIDIPKFKQIPGIRYVLNAGKNKIKIFADNIEEQSFITEEIQKLNPTLLGITSDTGTFLEYFRIRGRHVEGI